MADAREKQTILIVASLASFLVPYTGFSITVELPAISAANYPQFMASVKTAFFIFTLLCTIGIVASYARGTIR